MNQPISLLRESLQKNPNSTEILGALGRACQKENLLEEAVTFYGKALDLAPGSLENWINFGSALLELKRTDEAIAAFVEARKIAPEKTGPHFSLGAAYMAANRYDESRICLNHALNMDPDCIPARQNLSLLLAAQCRHEEALVELQRAFKLHPNDAEFLLEESHLRLALGDFKKGFECYESRLHPKNKRAGNIDIPDFPQPRMQRPEDAIGKTVMLFDEMGIGDALQFVRYTQYVARDAKKVIVCARPALSSLFRSSAGVHEVVAFGPLPSFDVYASLMSMPYIYGSTVQNIPATTPYLHADKAKQVSWRSRLGNRAGRYVGLAWAGNPAHDNDNNRSMTLAALSPLLKLDSINFVSLQQQLRDSDKPLQRSLNLRHFGSTLMDFSDTAALCSCMDLIISVDTSIAHLAGALGKPVWIMLPWSAEWRWMMNREDSPWYPTARLFRQPKLADWGSVVQRITEELKPADSFNFLRRLLRR